MDLLKGLSLFSGIGGIDIALREWVRPVAYCEIEPYCQSVLLQRMSEGYLFKAPIWPDVQTLPYNELPAIDIIYGGFPCQDISIAGRGAGLEGKRSGLFFEIVRLAKEIKPRLLFLENVPAITTRGGLRVVREIASLGYDCRWCVISASSVGALHRRERWFLLSNSRSQGLEGLRNGAIGTISEKPMSSSGSDDVANTESGKCFRLSSGTPKGQPSVGIGSQYYTVNEWQEAVSSICRTTNGIPNRVDRLKALGNAVVPQQVYQAFKILSGL